MNEKSIFLFYCAWKYERITFKIEDIFSNDLTIQKAHFQQK